VRPSQDAGRAAGAGLSRRAGRAGSATLLEFARERGLKPLPDLPLSGPSETWLKRVRAALLDEHVNQDSFNELNEAFQGYRRSLSAVEADELGRRVREFDQVKFVILEVEAEERAKAEGER
jgi:hypothetical protein